MRMLMCGLTLSLGTLAGNVQAEKMLNVNGIDYPQSALLESCQSMSSDPAGQIACFSALSKLIEEQSNREQENALSVPEALEVLRTAAQYQDDDSGLSITGSDCSIHIVYFNNYFHISRRNISTIDLYSAQFDASKLQYDPAIAVQSAQVLLSKGMMDVGATASVRGGLALESAEHNFTPRSPRTTIDVYANEVDSQLPAKQNQAFDFVLVHPERSQASAEIWSAFEAFVNACE